MSDPNDALAADPVLGPVVEAHGPVDLEPAEDLYRRLVVSLVRQQVSTEAAAAIRERLFDCLEVTPESVLAADPGRLREAGLSAAKTEYVRAAARAFRERGWDREYFAGMDDDDVRARLTEVHGIGPWTADMVLMGPNRFRKFSKLPAGLSSLGVCQLPKGVLETDCLGKQSPLALLWQ